MHRIIDWFKSNIYGWYYSFNGHKEFRIVFKIGRKPNPNNKPPTVIKE